MSGAAASFRTAAIVAALLVTGCHGKPTGQVIASVNGDDITTQDLDAEVRAARIPAHADGAAVRAEIIRNVVDRVLLFQLAKKEQLDRDPTYIADERRTQQLMLADRAVEQAAADPPTPDSQRVEAYLLGNRALLDGRVVLTIDQLRFPTPADPQRLARLTAAKTFGEALAMLVGWNTPFERSAVPVDTGLLPVQSASALQSVAVGEAIISSAGGITNFGAVVRRAPVAMSNSDRLALATRILQAEGRAPAIRAVLDGARRDAKILYQPAFDPGNKPATPRP